MPELTDETDDLPPMREGTIVLGVVLLLIVIVATSVQRFPGTLWKGGEVYEFGSICALLAYAGIAYAVRGVETGQSRTAVRTGSILGVSCAAIELVVYFIASRIETIRAAVTAQYVDAALLVGFLGAAALIACWRHRLIGPVLLASVWLAVVTTTCMLLLASRRLLIAPHLGAGALASYENSGMTDPQAYVIRETLHSMPGALVVPLVEGVVVGGVIAWCLLLLGKRKTREYVP